MGIGPYVESIADIGVSHVTITVCAVDPEIGSRIYAWVRGCKCRPIMVRRRRICLLARQVHAIRSLKRFGVSVKVNCIVIPGVNDNHVVEIAAEMKKLGWTCSIALRCFRL